MDLREGAELNMGRIIVRFPRPLIITFGWLVVAACIAISAAIGIALAAALQAIFPRLVIP